MGPGPKKTTDLHKHTTPQYRAIKMHSPSLVSDDWPKYKKFLHYLMLYKSRFFPGSCQILEKGGKSMITLPSPDHTSDLKCKVYSLNSSLPGSEYQNIWKSSRGSIEVNEGTIRFLSRSMKFLGASVSTVEWRCKFQWNTPVSMRTYQTQFPSAREPRNWGLPWPTWTEQILEWNFIGFIG